MNPVLSYNLNPNRTLPFQIAKKSLRSIQSKRSYCYVVKFKPVKYMMKGSDGSFRVTS